MASLANTLFSIAIGVPAALATGTPAWGTPKPASADQTRTEYILRAVPSTTELKIKIQPGLEPVDPIEALKLKAYEFSSFTNGWDGSGSLAPSGESIDAALAFIEILPGGLPLPEIMLSQAGEVGFYWDLIGGYADISFAETGLGSFFSRVKSGEEIFLDDLARGTFTRDWFFEQLGGMAAPERRAA
jgi:hypothetical protein